MVMASPPTFEPGIALSNAFYDDVLRPLVGDLPHAAGLLGPGSDVLGLDSERSTDHDWGPRAQLFVAEDDIEAVRNAVEQSLPDTFRGWPTRFGNDRNEPADHVTVTTLDGWLQEQLGFDPTTEVTRQNWLATPQQLLLGVTGGSVFRDDSGALTNVRERLSWYPDQVWLWLLACQWRRVEQEQPFVGRAVEAGDDLGARVVTARLVRDLMRLCFLLERRYAPYSKWLGSGFSRLDAAATVGPLLAEALSGDSSGRRQAALDEASTAVAELHNDVGVTEAVAPALRPFHDRPYQVLGAERFVAACLEQVDDASLRALPLTGGVDQYVDSTDVLSRPELTKRIGALLYLD
jgi:hypothetical protein